MNKYFSTGEYYHIYTHSNGFENLFNSEANYLYFLRKYFEKLSPYLDTIAYCLMPNHLHLLVRIKEITAYASPSKGFKPLEGEAISKTISQKFSNLFNGYAQAYNNMYKRKGSLFIPNFKRKIVKNEHYLITLVAYIHCNPIKHEFSKSMETWKYSSWKDYLEAKSNNIYTTEIIELFGSKKKLIEFHEEYLQMIISSENI